MNTTPQLSASLQEAFDHPARGVVGLVDDLLRLCPAQGIQLEWDAGRCRVRTLVADMQEIFDWPLPKSVFRAILARVAALCNERSPNSVSPYGGHGELSLGANPSIAFHATLRNVTDEQRLELIPVPATQAAGSHNEERTSDVPVLTSLRKRVMEKPSVFIGSSFEGLRIAEAVFTHLSHEAKPKLWTNELFLPGQYPMETLEHQLRENAFAVLVASPEDEIIKRGVAFPAMRDNLLLEFGLFTGALGRKRAFFLCPDIPTVELPSNLLGMIVAKYDGARAKAGEIASAVQVSCQRIRAVIAEQWAIIAQERERFTAGVRASEKGKAVERLHKVVVRLRDAVMVVQRDAFAAVSDEAAFNKVKLAASRKVGEIAQAFSEDATLIGVASQVSRLAAVTCDAISDLPFPREPALGKDAVREKMIDTGIGAIGAFLGGGDPFRHVENAATGEADRRVSRLKEQYMEWWDEHYPILEEATFNLQDRLFLAAMDLASAALAGTHAR
jgi:predicted nucleotide-binding protein